MAFSWACPPLRTGAYSLTLPRPLIASRPAGDDPSRYSCLTSPAYLMFMLGGLRPPADQGNPSSSVWLSREFLTESERYPWPDCGLDRLPPLIGARLVQLQAQPDL